MIRTFTDISIPIFALLAIGFGVCGTETVSWRYTVAGIIFAFIAIILAEGLLVI